MRTIHETDYHWFTRLGHHNSTIEINIPPSHVGAEARLYGAEDGPSFVAIRRFRERLSDGSDKVHDFGENYWDWPPAIYNFVSSVSFGTFQGYFPSRTYAVGRLDFWR